LRTSIEKFERNINYLKKQQQYDLITAQVFKHFANASRAVAQQISDDSTAWCNAASKRLSNIESDIAKVNERIPRLTNEAPLSDTGIGYSPVEIPVWEIINYFRNREKH
jgi:hypothetical protein